MAFKCTMLLQLATNVGDQTAPNRRLAGWSESFYDTSSSFPPIQTDFLELCRRRAAMLPRGASIVGQRYQQVNPVAPSQTGSTYYPGSDLWAADTPDMTLLCRCPSRSTRNIRPMYLRGIPDVMVKEGEYSPTAPFTAALNAFFARLSGYSFRGRDLAQTAYPANSIKTTGEYILQVANPFVNHDQVRVSRAKQKSTGLFVGGVFQVSVNFNQPDLLLNWPYGDCTGGTIRKIATVFSFIAQDRIAISRIVRKKVGRPFDQYRGRASNRR